MSKVVFDDATHTYTVDGVELPSVTHICRFLHHDTAINAKPWLRDAAADRGSRIHAYTAMIDYGEPLVDEEIDIDCLGYVQAYRRFLKDYKPEWCGIETIMGSTELGIAGTCDRYGNVDGVRTIVDIKTGSSVNSAAVLTQLEGYWKLLHKEKGFFADASEVLLLRKDWTYEFRALGDETPILWDECFQLHKSLSQKGLTIR